MSDIVDLRADAGPEGARALPLESCRRLLLDEMEKNARLKSILADNLCWMDADPAAARALPPEEMLESCKRYIAQITGKFGILQAGQMTIAQLTEKVERLEAEFREVCAQSERFRQGGVAAQQQTQLVAEAKDAEIERLEAELQVYRVATSP